MLSPQSMSFDVDSRTGPGNLSTTNTTGFTLQLQKLKAYAGRKLPGDKIWKIARMTVTIAGTYDYTSLQSAATAGRRLYEFVSRMQLSPKGWKPGNMIDAGGKALRRRSLFMWGKQPSADPAATVDADATNIAYRLVLPVDCWDPHAERHEDYAPSVIHVGDGSLQLDFNATALTAITLDDSPTITVDADIFAGDPEVPMIWRFNERLAQSGNRFPFNLSCDYLRNLWLHVRGSQESSGSNLEAIFEGDRTVQVEAGGVRVLEDQSVTSLAERLNRLMITDRADAETESDPAVLPIMLFHQTKNTKPLSFANDGFLEASAELRNSASDSTGNDIMICADEVYEPRDGSEVLRQYLAAGGASGSVQTGRATKSKKKTIAGDKAGRVPARIIG